MIIDKAVVRFKDKMLMKGRTGNFSPDNSFFHMKLLSGESVKVDIAKLKALFIVKSFQGNRQYQYTYGDVLPWGGKKVKVEFKDGEVIIGYTTYYQSVGTGFFITPADLKGNNKQVFVVTSATRKISYM